MNDIEKMIRAIPAEEFARIGRKMASALSVHGGMYRCPRCGSRLNANATFVWCSFVGDYHQNIKACTYGIDEAITLESISSRIVAEGA